ncbi:MAG: monovalent cation/H(+) antiporter subunit G [Rhodospirillales bacterium]
MALLADIASWACLIAGSLFALIGAVGINRLPDVFARMHGAGIVDTLGMGLILAGLMIHEGFTMVTVKLVLIVVFIFFASPTTTHALARAALNGGVKPVVDGKKGPSAKTSERTGRPSKT